MPSEPSGKSERPTANEPTCTRGFMTLIVVPFNLACKASSIGPKQHGYMLPLLDGVSTDSW